MNDQVRRCWETALGLLQPSEAELQRGLEWHREALVCDTYGFAPNACFDGEALARAAEAGASALELQDLREDMNMTRWATVPEERQEFEAAFDQAGVTCIFQNAGEESQDPLRLMKRLARFTYATDVRREFVAHAATPEEIVEAKGAGRHCLYFSGNGVPLAQGWVSPEEESGYVRVFMQLGIRMMHLTYNRRNMIGDGCAEPANAGLSDFGRSVIAEMNRQGVIVDCAHSGWQTSLEAARASGKPMVASHSACAALQQHHRCKPDEVIRAIADTGGYIGICAVPAFLGGRGTIVDFLDHIDHVVRLVGVEHVGIGTDTAYVPERQEAEWGKLPTRGRERKAWENFWWVDDPVSRPEWNTGVQREGLAWTNWPLFTVGLVQRGYAEEDIRKIVGGNMLRVAREVWEGREAGCGRHP